MPVSTRSRNRGPRTASYYVYEDVEDSMDVSDEWEPAKEKKPRAPKRELSSSSSSDDESWSGDNSVIENRNERMRLRPWLENEINSGKCTGLSWLDRKNKIVKIPWKHASRHGWRLGDACLFQRWAIHSGKYCAGMKPNPKRWKANFRCALNSLADIKEVKEYSKKRGSDAFKVYQLLPPGKRGQDTTCKIKTEPKIEKPALGECNVNLLPVTVMDLEMKMKEDEKNEKKVTEIKKKPIKRRQPKAHSRIKVKREDDYDHEQQVPDFQEEYKCNGLFDHDSYTLSKHSEGHKVKEESELESCNGGYKFNGSPTGDWRAGDMYRSSYEASTTSNWHGSDDDEDVPTEEQVINDVIEMQTSCSDDSGVNYTLDDRYSSSPSSICDWMTEDIPEPTCQWNEDLMKSANPLMMTTFADDFTLPCIAQPVHGSLTESEEHQLEWQPAGLQYQDL